MSGFLLTFIVAKLQRKLIFILFYFLFWRELARKTVEMCFFFTMIDR